MKFFVILILAGILPIGSLYSQNIKVRITEAFTNRPIENIKVYASVDEDISVAITNSDGIAEFEVNTVFNLNILAIDPSYNYAYGAYKVTTSQHIYEFQLTKYPRNEYEVGNMLDNLLEVLSLGLDIYQLAELSTSLTTKSLEGTGFGIPGVFSISPIPTRGPDGRIGFTLSGVLAEDLMKFGSRIKSPGHNCFYDCKLNGAY